MLSNLVRAVVERVFLNSSFQEVPQAKPGKFEKMDYFTRRVARHVGRPLPRSRIDFVNSYSGSQLKTYTRALHTFNQCPMVTCADALNKCFVKVEKINFSTKVDPAPRLILPKNPRFNIELGRYLKHIEHRVYNAIGKVFGGTTVFKGLNGLQRGRLFNTKARKFQRPAFVGIDAARFDQHTGQSALKFEHSLYHQIYPGDVKLKWLLEQQLVTRAIGYATDGKLRFTRNGGRCSGDMNTSLGNCYISCALVFEYMTSKGVLFEVANDGDDTVIILEASNLHLLDDLTTWFLDYGYTMKVEDPVFELEKLEFCQCHPVKNADGFYTMVRNPRKAFECDLVSNKVTTEAEALAHASAIRESGLSLNSGIPVFQAFYASLPKGGTKAVLPEYGFRHLAQGMESKERKVTPESRASFYLAYGVTPDAQIELEKYFSRGINNSLIHPIDHKFPLLHNLRSKLLKYC